jgi:hypothetical protein
VQGIKSNIGKSPGRFLRLCGSAEQEGGWKGDRSNAVAIDKVSNCFRAARRNLAQEISSSGSLASTDDSPQEDCQQEGQLACLPAASVTTTSTTPHTTSVGVSLLKDAPSPFYSIHAAAASHSSLIIGAGQHAVSGMLWTPPPSCQQRTTIRTELLEEPRHSEKGINKESSLDDRPAAAAARLTHCQYFLPDQGSRSGNDSDKLNTHNSAMKECSQSFALPLKNPVLFPAAEGL